jgi:hypothetical protein
VGPFELEAAGFARQPLFFDFRGRLMSRGPMRPLIPILALALASCGGDGPANNAAVAEDTGAEQVTPVNDVTAIDAATGEAANMAADVDYTFNEEDLNALGEDAAADATAANNDL